mmetsp:Transcript_17425/g.50761  ORF Transcript_17425/g.50761 Transcript_17425/m.50761 type:complete len:289 (-) Transcript_17425:1110-1976(-)
MQSLPRMNRRPRPHPHGMFQILRMIRHIDVGIEVRIEFEIEPSQYHRQRDRRLQHREFVPDALSGPPPERQIREIGRDFVGVQFPLPSLRIVSGPALDVGIDVPLVEALRTERVGLRPESSVPMNVVQRDEEVHAPDGGRLSSSSLGDDVLLPAATDQQRRFGIHPQSLGDDQTQISHPLDILQGRIAISHDLIDLGPYLGHAFGVLGQFEQRPGQDRGGGLVPGDEHGHQIVPQLLVIDIGAPHIDQESQQARIVDLIVIPILQLLQIFHLPGGLGPIDEIVQYVVQ